MISYNFICKKCGNKKTITTEPEKISETVVTCDECGEVMKRDWKTLLTVPEYMKAAETQEMAWIKDRLKNRPSGKRKVLY